MPVEPDEMPVPQPTPEIKQPSDPKEPEIPQEDPENIPPEIAPGETEKPEHRPQQPGY